MHCAGTTRLLFVERGACVLGQPLARVSIDGLDAGARGIIASRVFTLDSLHVAAAASRAATLTLGFPAGYLDVTFGSQMAARECFDLLSDAVADHTAAAIQALGGLLAMSCPLRKHAVPSATPKRKPVGGTARAKRATATTAAAPTITAAPAAAAAAAVESEVAQSLS